MRKRKVTLRAEHDGPDSRYLTASINADGALVIEGQDLGPGTALVSSDGEYERTRTILAEVRQGPQTSALDPQSTYHYIKSKWG